MSDGPNAVNRAEFITVFPSGITAAATWDRNLIYQRAHALGEEARGKGTKVLLGYVHAMIPHINKARQFLEN